MANDIAARPWRLDTPNPAVAIWTGWVSIEGVEFASYGAQGDVAELLDVNGRVVWRATGANDLSAQRIGRIGWVQGLILSKCDNGGVVVVYVK